MRADPANNDVDASTMFAHEEMDVPACRWPLCWGPRSLERYLLPGFKGRLLFSTRLCLSTALACAWVFAPQTAALFPPNILIPLAAVSVSGKLWPSVLPLLLLQPTSCFVPVSLHTSPSDTRKGLNAAFLCQSLLRLEWYE